MVIVAKTDHYANFSEPKGISEQPGLRIFNETPPGAGGRPETWRRSTLSFLPLMTTKRLTIEREFTQPRTFILDLAMTSEWGHEK